MRIAILLLTFLLSFQLRAQPDKATHLLKDAIDRLGGETLLGSIRTLHYKAHGHTYALEQSERPEGPFVVNYFNSSYVSLAAEKKCLYTTRPMFVSPTAANRELKILVHGNTVGVDFGRNGFFPAFPETIEYLYLAPHVVLKEALAKHASYVKDTVMQQVPHAIVTYRWEQSPVKLFINLNSGYLTGVEVKKAYKSGFSQVWGDHRRLHLYSYWKLEKNGLHFPYQRDTYINGQLAETETIDSLHVNRPTGLDTLTFSDADIKTMESYGNRMVAKGKMEEIAPDVYQIRASWNVGIVKTAEGIYIIEAPISSEFSKGVISEVKQKFPGEKIRGVISTSDAWPHFGGVREYVAHGIPVHVLDINKPMVDRIIGSAYLTYPDSLQKKRVKPVIRTISAKTTLSSQKQSFTIYPYHTETGERMMMVYFPELKLLYASDLIIPQKEGFFMPQYLSEAVDAITREGLAVETIFGMHLPPMPFKKVTDYLAAWTK